MRLDELLSEVQERLGAVLATRDRTHALMDAIVETSSGLDLDAVLRRLIESAVDLVDARYGALGVIGDGMRLARFVPVGLTDEEILRIEHWPEGHGILGLLVKHPQTLRLSDIADHPESYGFPPGHPPMKSFLGVPIRVGDDVFGNLYLTEKRGGTDFDDEDERVITALASAAAVAVENARLYDEVHRRERWLTASEKVTRDLLSGADPGEVFEHLAGAARELTGTSLGLIARPDGTGRQLLVTSADGVDSDDMRGRLIDVGTSLLGEAFRSGRPAVTDDAVAAGYRTPLAGTAGFGPVIAVPFVVHGATRGVLEVAGERGDPPFGDVTLRLLQTFGDQAAVAVELAERRQDVERLAILEDRNRIAHDLHDLVIQRLFANGMALSSAAQLAQRPEVAARISEVIDDLDATIRQIRTSIYGLQPPAHAALSLQARMLNAITEHTPQLAHTPATTFTGPVDSTVDDETGEHALAALREMLSNTARHAHAAHTWITITADPSELCVRVDDDGKGIPEETTRRSGLANLHDRATRLGGTFTIAPREAAGTTAQWRVPLP
jgi:signal transduction histidine kinase